MVILGSINYQVVAVEKSEMTSTLKKSSTIDLPSEAFLSFLASGISVNENKKEKTDKQLSKTHFIDPMEIKALDDIGLLAKIETKSAMKTTNIKQNKMEDLK